MWSSMQAPRALSHGDGALGAGTRTSSPEHAGFGRLSSGTALVVVSLDVVPLQPSSSVKTVSGCLLGCYPAGRDLWGGKLAAGGITAVPISPILKLFAWGEGDSVLRETTSRGLCGP